MGNTESTIKEYENRPLFLSKYNWILSYPLRQYDYINLDKFGKNSNIDKKYVDLRINCPPVLDNENIPVHPISTVCSMLNYQLNRNKLNTFPPSRLFIYHNCNFFNNVTSLFTYEIIFKSIEKYGFCSEIDFRFNENNLEQKPDLKHYDIAEAYKFVEIYKVNNNLEVLKKMLINDMPIMAGIVLYTDLGKIVDKLWIPEKEDIKVGGITCLIVGFSDDRKCFFAKFAFGKNFGNSGYIMIPYEYIEDTHLTPELYYLDLKKNRIEGFLNQRRETISLEKKMKTTSSYNNTNSFF